MEKWYTKLHRYGQTNLTEIDPEVCDLDFWINYWEQSHTQAIIVNAGGIVAYYPSKFTLQYRAAYLNNTDFFGEFVSAARSKNIAVLARMDINRGSKEFFDAHPEWFARKKNHEPYLTQGRYQFCINSGYYKEYVPEILIEIINRYHPEGFTDNSWTGISREHICYCESCRKSFYEFCNESLPVHADYKDPVYRKWITWSYKSRIDNWDLYNDVCKKHGGDDCLWLGMVNANFVSGHASFCDLREVCKRSQIIMVDHQSRDGNGFEQNSLNGMVLHQMVGWDKIIPESMSHYVRGTQTYRRTASEPLELQLWMLEGFAGGISPWWHIVGAAQEDTRFFELSNNILSWHKKNETYLYNRTPIANIGVLWSQANVEFFGQDQAKNRVELSWRGINMALTRAGIPYLPINADDIIQQSTEIDLLILPELAVISETQAQAIKTVFNEGKHILAFGNIGIMNEEGDLHPDCILSDVLGIDFEKAEITDTQSDSNWEHPVVHNYFRIQEKTHPLFRGFEKTTILPLGGKHKKVSLKPGTKILSTYIPEFPIYPPEFSWTTNTHTDEAVITEYINAQKAKSVYFSWDLDSCYGRCALPDHGNIIKNAVQYLLDGSEKISVESNAYIDIKAYKQKGAIIVHLINLTYSGFTQGYAEHHIPISNVVLRLHIADFQVNSVTSTVKQNSTKTEKKGGIYVITLESLDIHEMLVIE